MKFITRPQFVEAIQFTRDNFEEVVKFTNGFASGSHLQGYEEAYCYLYQNDLVVEGDWIVFDEDSNLFKAVLEKDFQAKYEAFEE